MCAGLLRDQQELFLYEFGKTFKQGQLWRPLTAAMHLGKVDMGMASQIYFLISYGQEMERQDGPAQHFMFIAVQVLLHPTPRPHYHIFPPPYILPKNHLKAISPTKVNRGDCLPKNLRLVLPCDRSSS